MNRIAQVTITNGAECENGHKSIVAYPLGVANALHAQARAGTLTCDKCHARLLLDVYRPQSSLLILP